MRFKEHIADWLILIVLWAVVAAMFLALQENTSWTLLFPATGLLWTVAPLIATSFPTRNLVVGSIVTLVAVSFLFLAAVWLAVAVLGFFAWIVIEGAGQPEGDALAVTLALEGLKLLAGGALGVVVGVGLRRRNLVLRPEAGS